MKLCLIKVDHAVASEPTAGPDVLQGQGEVYASRVRYVQVVGIVLVPLLDGGENLTLICAHNMHVLENRKIKKEKRQLRVRKKTAEVISEDPC